MVFSNLVFIFVFLPVVLLLYFLAPKKLKNLLLVIISLFFYAWGEPKYVFLMIFSIIMNYFFGLIIEKCKQHRTSQLFVLTLGVIGNLLILGYYKYSEFLLLNLNALFGTDFQIESLPLPIGLSFFTFQALSYLVDLYRKDAEIQRNIIDFSLYISLFPPLVAGPIVRYNTIAEQIKSRIITNEKFADGVKKFIIGLAKKVILANTFGRIADEIFAMPAGEISVLSAWIGIVAYSLQIYFDFSGYSDMAIGLGKMFGFDLLENFNYPYISRSISEFWRRWHISLSSWFRDYLYIPLGGNRVAEWKIYRNLLIVWTATGFWHGASWTFMAWGFYYGIIISIERLGFSRLLKKLWTPLQHVYVLLIVMVGWVFFRADHFTYSFEYIQTLFGFGGNGIVDSTALVYLNDYWYIFGIAMVASTPIYVKIKTGMEGFSTKKILYGFYQVMTPALYMMLLIIATILLVNSTYNPFIYFRF